MVDWLLVVILIIVIWILLLMVFSKKIAQTKHFQVYGPFLMFKSIKNRGVLDKLTSKDSSKWFSRMSVGLVLIFLFLGIALLLYESYLATQIKEVVSPPLQEYLVLPGINPAIPIVYGTVALVFAVLIHETMHGITARKHGLPVKSVGALFFIIPIGAFVEPEMESLMAADPVVRRRVFAAGPSINIVIAAITFLLLILVLMPSVHAIDQGVYVQSVESNSVYSHFISPGDELIAFGQYSGRNLTNELLNSTILPGTFVSSRVAAGSNIATYSLPAGVVLCSTVKGYPASGVGMKDGGIIESINGSIIYNENVLTSVLNGIEPGSNITVDMLYYSYSNGHFSEISNNYSLVTASKYTYYSQYAPGYNSPSYRNESFLGVSVDYAGISGYSIDYARSTVFGADAVYGGTSGILTTLALPFEGLSPVPAPMAALFSTPFYAPLFWFIVNMTFWIFYLSFLLGLTNALPLFITDGGQFLKDTIFIAGKKRKIKSLSDERVAGNIANYLGLFIVFLIFWELLIPRII